MIKSLAREEGLHGAERVTETSGVSLLHQEASAGSAQTP